MDLGLAGKVVLVTGGGGGAGPSIADAFAAEGAAVAVHYRSSAGRAEDAAGAIRDGGGRAIAVQADLGKPRLDRRGRCDRRARARAGRRAGHRDVRVPQQPAHRDIRRGLGGGRRRHARGHVPRLPGGDPVDAGGRVRSDRQHRRAVGTRRRGALGALRRGQGGDRGPHQVTREGAAARTASSSTRSPP